MRCLVTGAAGFIGSHLVDALIERGYSVTGVDNLSVGRLANLEHQSDQKNFNFINCDITIKAEVDKLEKKFDFIFHLAALADIVPSIENPERYLLTNVIGTANILQLAQKHNVKRFLYAASSSCYGIPKEIPTPETAQITVKYPYALSKYLGELVVEHWSKIYRVRATSLRLFNVYGPRARTSGTYGAVFGVFLAQKISGKPLTVVGDGTQSRDFTYVSDVVEAFIMASESDSEWDLFNVGSGGTYSINELVKLLECPSESLPKRPGEPDVTFADISKIKTQLGWAPKITFSQGVSKILENLESWSGAPVWTVKDIETATKSWFHYLSEDSSD